MKNKFESYIREGKKWFLKKRKKIIKSKALPQNSFVKAALLFWLIFFMGLFLRMLVLKPTGIYAGHPYVWSDWSLHIGMAQIFATKSPSDWFSNHPLYSGGKFTYGFLSNLISGLLMRLGFSLASAFIIPSIIFSLFLVIGLYRLSKILLKSEKAAILAVSLFFLSSGFGFIKFFQDFSKNPSLSLLLYPPIEYSKDDNYEWGSGNSLVGMLVPQRSFLLGLPLAIWALILFLAGIKLKEERKYKRLLLIGGILAGILPIAHMHSFIALGIICFCFCLLNLKEWKKILWFALPSITVGGILYLNFIAGGIENPDFMSWFPGWTVKGNFLDWIYMWLKLWGFMLPIAIITLLFFKKKINKNLLSISLASMLIFILGNLFLFQPIHWDNSKLFLWSYLGFSILAAYGIKELWSKSLYFKFICFYLIISLSATGALELIRLQRVDRNTYQMISTKEMMFADRIRNETDPNAIFATNSSHNHPVTMWSARPLVLGYTAWVWNFGFMYSERENDLTAIFEAKNDIKPLIKKYSISYVYVGESEINRYKVNLNYFKKNFPIAFENDSTLVFDVRFVITSE